MTFTWMGYGMRGTAISIRCQCLACESYWVFTQYQWVLLWSITQWYTSHILHEYVLPHLHTFQLDPNDRISFTKCKLQMSINFGNPQKCFRNLNFRNRRWPKIPIKTWGPRKSIHHTIIRTALFLLYSLSISFSHTQIVYIVSTDKIDAKRQKPYTMSHYLWHMCIIPKTHLKT